MMKLRKLHFCQVVYQYFFIVYRCSIHVLKCITSIPIKYKYILIDCGGGGDVILKSTKGRIIKKGWKTLL